MKAIVYWISIAILFLAEAGAMFALAKNGADGYVVPGLIHLAVALAFATLTGIHRKSVSVFMLSILIIGTTPILGILTMILIDEKFNRETRHAYFESAKNYEIGNPFISTEGGVEMVDNSELLREDSPPLVKRVQSPDCKVTEREVEALSSMRQIRVLALLEKIASSSSGEGRVLAQAAITSISEQASVWSANLHMLEVRKKEIPIAIERLAVSTYLRIRRDGRSPQAFGLPVAAEIKELLHKRLHHQPDSDSLTALTELLILEEELEEAEALIRSHQDTPGFHHELQLAKVHSARGEWMLLLQTLPGLKAEHWDALPEEVRSFWGVKN